MATQEFENRLQKVDRHISKWARRQGVTCYRVYDDDLTNFPLVIDRYEEALHVAEYHRQHELDEFQHQQWLEDCLSSISKVMAVPRHLIFFKERKRQKGQQQYEKVDAEKHQRLVRENGLNFLVNLSDYVDTGLFLDHRNTRQMIREQAEGKHFFEPFCLHRGFYCLCRCWWSTEHHHGRSIKYLPRLGTGQPEHQQFWPANRQSPLPRPG